MTTRTLRKVFAIWLPVAMLTATAACQGDVTKEGREELEVLLEDPVLSFRAPGTKLNSKEDRAAREPDWAGVMYDTSVQRIFEMEGDPGDTVEAYRRPAESAGWRLHSQQCSRSEHNTGLVFVKQQPFPAVLWITAHIPGAPGGAGPTTRRYLDVSLRPGPPPGEPVPERPGTRRGDPHCLRGLDPADPSLQPPQGPPRTPEEMCAVLPIADATAVVPTLAAAVPRPDSLISTCDYLDTMGQALLLVQEARRSRSDYEDDQYSARGGDEGFILLTDHGQERAGGVWVETDAGPVELRTLVSAVAEDELLALGRVLKR